MGVKTYGVLIDVTKNPVLMRWRREALAEGKALGKNSLLHEQLETKFGPLPKWAADRMASASPAQVERWAKKVLTAETLEAVLGKK
jgi:hypothetical protein